MPVRIDPKVEPNKIDMLKWRLEGRVIGQDRAIGQFVKALGKHYVNMTAPNRPITNLLFMGPTGVGKTELCHALAEILLDNREAITRIDCAEFNHSHEVAKLIGSPPGYLGHRESKARLNQESLDKWSNKPIHNPEKTVVTGVEKRPSILLFDEIEKAHEDLFDILLGIMDNGKITLGDNTTTDLTKTILVMTSNLGSKDVRGVTQGRGWGFQAGKNSEDLDQEIYEAAKKSAKKFFKPEFMNRLDRIVVFRSLDRESLRQIAQLEFQKLKRRVNTGTRFIEMKITPQALDFILAEGASEEYGARELKRVMERYIAEPVSNLIGSNQLIIGDCLTVGSDGKELVFEKTYDPVPPRKSLNEWFEKNVDLGIDKHKNK